MTERLENAQAVALHLGVSTATLHNWATRLDGFPEPDFDIMGPRNRLFARAWRADRLPELRAWVVTYKGFSEQKAAAHWAEVDEHIKTGASSSSKKARIHPDQMTIEVDA